MTTTSRILGLVASLAAVTALAGCGGSSGPTKADFTKKADAVCAATNRAHPPKPQPKNAKEAAQQQAEEIQIREELDKKLRALKAPGSVKADFDAYNAGTQTIIRDFTKMKADAKANLEKKFTKDSQAVVKAQVAREKYAIKLGFKTCGRKSPAQ